MVCGMNCKGDYYIPCLILPAEKEQPIGLWGQRHLRYLKRNTTEIHYTALFTSGRLNTYLADIDSAGTGTHGKAHRADETGTGYLGAVKGGKRFGMDTERIDNYTVRVQRELWKEKSSFA